jgi:UDP-N-acetylmuramyl pentapeptide phosphotransferase/UDP-N-acetylglucosamine-1-phosphate transferase
LIVLCITCAIAFLGFWAWKTERWAWLCVAGAMLVVQIIFLNLPPGQSIVFDGDGGALVFAAILMATFYAPRESNLYKSWGLRWGLLVIGALAFMLVFHTWSGSYDDIPFGEIEGVNLSDPSQLTEVYGWSVTQLVDRYLLLARICLVALALIYIWGLISAYVEARTAPRTVIR